MAQKSLSAASNQKKENGTFVDSYLCPKYLKTNILYDINL